MSYFINVNGRRIDDVLHEVCRYSGGTDTSIPIAWAHHYDDFDQIVIFTDSETWAGNQHGDVALHQYEQKVGHSVALTVVSAAGNQFTIDDPQNPNVLNIVGFDSTVPEIIRSR